MKAFETHAATQYLTFNLDGEVFALEVAKVREILDYTSVTRIPLSIGYIRGVINLRNSVVPVVDLRLKFSMGMTEKTVNTCIIVVEAAIDEEITVIGLLGDSVQEVLELEPNQVEPVPHLGTLLSSSFIRGMGVGGHGFMMIIDVDGLFAGADLEMFQGLEKAA